MTTPLPERQAPPSPASIALACRERGLRMTDQRRTIVQVLDEAHDHPDGEEVHRRAHRLDRRISLSTVYRTLKLFADLGILERHDFGAGRARYEQVATTHHDHLIDIETGQVIEFENSEIEAIQERIARELGYSLVGHRLELFGRALPKPAAATRAKRTLK